MKIFIRIFLVLLVIAALYLSLDVMLIGGIKQVVYSLNPFVPASVVIGVLKIIFCELPISIACILALSQWR